MDTTSLGSSPLTRGKQTFMFLFLPCRGLIPAHAGKTQVEQEVDEAAVGSSPLTRGKQVKANPTTGEVGLIPAHAGKTHHGSACGAAFAGSSPLTRGKLRGRGGLGPYRRLIPAHAGKTEQQPPEACRGGAHPRSRGENISATLISRPARGSSPLTRGKPAVDNVPLATSRLIPAHAGKTPRWSPRPPGQPAHPRSRGENRDMAALVVAGVGSSPLTRGKHALATDRRRG